MASHTSEFTLFGPIITSQAAKAEEQIKHLLPAEFDNTCNNNACGKPMEFMPVSYLTHHKPFATYQCPHCRLRLLIFEAPITPMFVWSTEYAGCSDFSKFIDQLIIKREHKLEVRAKRHAQD